MPVTATSAAVATADIPKTVKLHDNATGKHLGSITNSPGDNTAYMRQKNGEHVATIVTNPDGTKISYDPSGKVIESASCWK